MKHKVKDYRAGCFVCHDVQAHWHGKGANTKASLHHKKTGHETWYELILSVRYIKDKEQEVKND